MARHRADRSLTGVVVGVPLTLLAVLTWTAVTQSPAAAEAMAKRHAPAWNATTGDHGPNDMRAGNGRRNKNYAALNSPTIIDGLQAVSNTVIGGYTQTQAAMCKKKHRRCTIFQKIRVSNEASDRR
ncbi:hypothetical protein [Sphaerisporangium perillae]|uniref:hypothetical protein n=1 Tax=Sphaerisporangium perillae TaxID=2935860 RepID=UPI00200F3DC4|nr:hypothetical protein [Sphaerisporangium perillae]